MAVKTITFIDPYGKARVVPESDEQKVTAAGWRPAVKMNDPAGKARWVPEGDLPKVTAAGWKPVADALPESNAVQRAYDRFIAPISGNEHAGVALDAIQNFARHTAMAAHPIFHPQEDAKALLKSAYEEDPLVIAQKMREGYKQNGWRGAVDAYEDTAKNSTIGKMIGGTAKDFKDNGVVQGAAGLAGDVAGAYLGGEATKAIAKPLAAPLSKGAETMRAAADRFPGAVGRGKNAAMRSLYPKNESLTPHEVAAQNLIKAMVPDEAAVPNIKSAASEVGDAMAAAKRKGMPVNGELDAAKSLRDRGAEVQKHYTEKLMRPHSGKFQGVPDNYNGEMSGNGKNQATVGQINDRVDAINRELKSNFRKKLSQQTTEANASDADLNAEKGALTKILHESLGEFNGLDPKEIADVRQRAGKLRSLADEMEASGNKKTVQAGRRESGSTTSPFKSGMESAADKFSGGPEIVGNRAVKGALEGFDATEKPLPEPVLPDPSTTATTPEAAQREFLRAHELELAAQDAAKSRNAVAEDQRTANTDTQKDIADKEFLQANKLEQSSQDSAAARFKAASDARAGKATVPASQPQIPKEPTPLPEKAEAPKATPLESPTTVIPPSPAPISLPTPMVDKEVVAADPSRGVKPVNLQVIDATPQSHVFSKTAAKAADPSIDVEAAAKAAAKAGFEVQE